MRTILVLVLLPIVTAVCPGQNGWTIQNAGTSTKLFSASAVDLNVCWMTGNNAVIRTTDGGLNWTSVWDPETSLHSHTIHAIDANTALVVSCKGFEDTWEAGDTKIYRTTDGGVSWQSVYSSTASTAFLCGLKMANSTVGYAYGDPVSNKWVVLKTTNAGASWVSMNTAPSAATGQGGMFSGLEVLTPTYIWFGGSGRMYRSTDGGSTWSFAAYPFGSLIMSICFTDANIGYAGTVNSKVIGRTTDGGVTWNSTSFPTVTNGTHIVSAGGDLFASRVYQVYRSTDNGSSWDAIRAISGGFYTCPAFVKVGSVLRGWVAASNGTIHSYREGPVSVDRDGGSTLPSSVVLEQNYPNPFNPSTTIRYGLPERSQVSLAVYNTLGQQVSVLLNGEQGAGYHDVKFDASAMPSGAYFYRLQAGSCVETRKLFLVR